MSLWQEFKKDSHMDTMPGKTGKLLLSSVFPLYVMGRKISARRLDNAYKKYVTDKNPLSKAIFYGIESEAFRLIDNGMNVRDLNDNMLELVIKYGRHLGHEKFIGKLAAMNFHPRYKADALHAAIEHFNMDILDALIQAGVNINTEINGMTPIMKAIDNTNIQAFKKLVALNADITRGSCHRELVTLSGQVQNTRMTAYELALYRGDEEMIELVRDAYFIQAPHLLRDFEKSDEKIGEIVMREEREEKLLNNGTAVLVGLAIIGGLFMIKGCGQTQEVTDFHRNIPNLRPQNASELLQKDDSCAHSGKQDVVSTYIYKQVIDKTKEYVRG